MGFLSKFTGLFSKSDEQRHNEAFAQSFLENPEPWLINLVHGGGVPGGVAVNKETALRVSAFYFCLKTFAEKIASFPINIYKVDKNGDEVIAYDHPNYKLLHYRPNRRQTSYKWKETSAVQLGAHGNSYSRIKTSPITGYIDSIEIIPFGKCKPVKVRNGKILAESDTGPFEIWYSVTGEDELIPAKQIIHWMNFSYNGVEGVDPVSAMRPTLQTSLSAKSYSNNYFENGTHSGGVFETDGTPPPEKREEATQNVLKAAGRQYGGIGNNGKSMVLWNGMKFRKLADNIKDSMLLEVINMNVPEIARCFGIPLAMVKENSGSTVIKNEQTMLQLRNSLLPTVTNIEQELDLKLLRDDEVGKYFHRLNMNVLLRVDTEALVSMTTALFNMGHINGDETRSFFGMPPMPDGLGKKYGEPFASNKKMFEDPKKEDPKKEEKSQHLNGTVKINGEDILINN